jgi:ABC-type glycerol-3-phosphate transport system substrate-binding protein
MRTQEEFMKTHTSVIAGALAIAFALAVPPASAQDATTSASSTTTTTSTSTRSTSASPDMIKEAIERSQARTEKARATGTPEVFGSEEPFSYDPTRTLNDLSTFR